MSQENVDRLRAGYEALSRGEQDLDFLAADFELHQASSIIDTAGVFHGRDALRDALAEIQESFEELSFKAERFIEAPAGEGGGLGRGRGPGPARGVGIDNRIAHGGGFRGDQAL